MIGEELKKILLKQRILPVLCLLLAVQFGYAAFRGLYSRYAPKVAEKYSQVYDMFAGPLEGAWDEEKEKKLDRWIEKRDDSLAGYNDLVDQMVVGEATEEEVYAYFQKTPFCHTAYINALDELDRQREYAREDAGRRYIMKPNGWIYFFEDHMVYALFFLLLLTLYIPLLIREEETQMSILQKLSARGMRQIFFCKWAAAVLVMWGGLALLMAEKYLIYYGRCRMDHMEYPIQSLPLFESCPWHVSIGAGILLEFLLLACGGYLLGGVITVFSAIISKALDVCLLTLVLVFAPLFVVSEERLFRVPVLTTLVFPKLLMYGWRDTEIGEQVYKSQGELLAISILGIFMGTILFWLAQRRAR